MLTNILSSLQKCVQNFIGAGNFIVESNSRSVFEIFVWCSLLP